jgi:hypothetical protein
VREVACYDVLVVIVVARRKSELWPAQVNVSYMHVTSAPPLLLSAVNVDE